MIAEALKMSSIPHFDQMSVTQMISFFHNQNWEFTEKADGTNVTFGMDEGEIFVKSKKGKPTTDPQDFIDIAKHFNNDIPLGFAELLTMLLNNEEKFTRWYDSVKQQYTNGRDFQLFGEMFNKSTMNVIEYSADKIGKGAIYLFLVKYVDDSGEVDISDSKQGKAIQTSFQSTFNGVDGWNIYTKVPVKVDLHRSKLIDKLSTILNDKSDILKSRKKVDKPAKIAAVEELESILREIKKGALEQIKSTESSLGGADIEGVVVRNIDSGALAKIVDKDFNEKRLEAWKGVDGLKKIRRQLFVDIQNQLLHGADIFVLPKKQIEKLSDELEVRGTQYDTVEDLLSVLYNDAIAERPQIARDIDNLVAKFPQLLTDYLKDMREFVESPEVSRNFQTFTNASNLLRTEETVVPQIIKSLNAAKTSSDKYIEIIKFFIGTQGVQDLVDVFLSSADD